MKLLNGTLSRSIVFFIVFTIICGVVYPVMMTGMAQIIFPEKANGSIIEVEGKKYGSALLGQQFTGDSHMWGRIMNIDTATYKDINGKQLMYAYPSNLSSASEEYGELITERITKIQSAHPEKSKIPIPVDLVTSSGSGLDPSISVAAAKYQIARLAKNNKLSVKEVEAIIEQCSESRFLGVFGEETVNVLKVNLMLDGILAYEKPEI